MQVSVENLEGLRRRIRVELPAPAIDARIDERLREIGRTAKLKGFRPGKVPASLIRDRHGTDVRRQVLQEILQQVCRDAIRQAGLEAVGPADVEQDPGAPADILALTATFETYPDFDVRGLDSLTVERPVVTVDDRDVDELIARLARQRRNWSVVTRAAQVGDRVLVDVATVDDRVAIVIGESTVRPAFTGSLVGKSAGDTVTLPVAYAPDFPDPGLAGRTIDHRLTLAEVAEGSLPPIDDAFAQAFGVAGGIAELRSAAAADMEREAAGEIRHEIRLQLLDQLAAATPMELPELLVEQELSRLARAATTRPGSLHLAELPSLTELSAVARRNVAIGLVARVIFREQKMRVLREDINAKIAATCTPGESVEEKQNWYAGHRDELDRIEHEVIDDKVVAWLEARARFVDRPMSFVELMDMRRRKWRQAHGAAA